MNLHLMRRLAGLVAGLLTHVFLGLQSGPRTMMRINFRASGDVR